MADGDALLVLPAVIHPGDVLQLARLQRGGLDAGAILVAIQRELHFGEALALEPAIYDFPRAIRHAEGNARYLLELVLRHVCPRVGHTERSFAGIHGHAILRQLLQPVELAGLDHVLAIDGLPVIPHGDDLIARSGPLIRESSALFRISVVAHVVVRHQHEGHAAVGVVADHVVVHAGVAAGVAEGQHRPLADLLGDLQNLVRLEVLDEQFVRSHHILADGEGMVQPFLLALFRGLQLHVHADDVVVGDVQHALDEHAADEAVGAGADVAGEAVFLQILHHLHHGQVEALRVGHALEAVRFPDENPRHEVGELIERHARVGPRRLDGVLHGHVSREGVVQRAVTKQPSHIQHLSVGLAVRVLQNAPGQHVVLEVRRVQLAHQRAVHVEHGDAVRLIDEIRGFGVGHVLHVVDQRVQRRGVGVPLSEVFLIILRPGRLFREGESGQGRRQGQKQHHCHCQSFHVRLPPSVLITGLANSDDFSPACLVSYNGKPISVFFKSGGEKVFFSVRIGEDDTAGSIRVIDADRDGT